MKQFTLILILFSLSGLLMGQKTEKAGETIFKYGISDYPVQFSENFLDANLNGIIEEQEITPGNVMQVSHFHCSKPEGQIYIASSVKESVEIDILDSSTKEVIKNIGTFETDPQKYNIISMNSLNLPKGKYIMEFSFLKSNLIYSKYLFWNMPLSKVVVPSYIPNRPIVELKSELTLNLEKGKSYHQILDTKGKMRDADVSSSWEMSYLVKDIHDSYYDIEVKYEKISMGLPYGGTTVFSSEKHNDEDDLSLMLAELINKAFSIKMEKNGNLKEVNMDESIIPDIFDKFPKFTGAGKQLLEIYMAAAYSEESFKSIEMIRAIFPDYPVSKGDKWLIKTQSGEGKNLNYETIYELKEITNSYYKIIGESKIETADKDAYIESFGSFGSPMKSDIKGTRISEILIDKKSGWVIEGKINEELRGDTYMRSQETSDNLRIPINSKIEIVIKSR